MPSFTKLVKVIFGKYLKPRLEIVLDAKYKYFNIGKDSLDS